MRLYCELKTKRDKDIARLLTRRPNPTVMYLIRLDGYPPRFEAHWADFKGYGYEERHFEQVSLPELLRTALAGQEEVVRDIANILKGKDDG